MFMHLLDHQPFRGLFLILPAGPGAVLALGLQRCRAQPLEDSPSSEGDRAGRSAKGRGPWRLLRWAAWHPCVSGLLCHAYGQKPPCGELSCLRSQGGLGPS